MKYVVCFSGGHSFALSAVETIRRFGRNQMILLNHKLTTCIAERKLKPETVG